MMLVLEGQHETQPKVMVLHLHFYCEEGNEYVAVFINLLSIHFLLGSALLHAPGSWHIGMASLGGIKEMKEKYRVVTKQKYEGIKNLEYLKKKLQDFLDWLCTMGPFMYFLQLSLSLTPGYNFLWLVTPAPGISHKRALSQISHLEGTCFVDLASGKIPGIGTG